MNYFNKFLTRKQDRYERLEGATTPDNPQNFNW